MPSNPLILCMRFDSAPLPLRRDVDLMRAEGVAKLRPAFGESVPWQE